jgi:hypothetical protein
MPRLSDKAIERIKAMPQVAEREHHQADPAALDQLAAALAEDDDDE